MYKNIFLYSYKKIINLKFTKINTICRTVTCNIQTKFETLSCSFIYTTTYIHAYIHHRILIYHVGCRILKFSMYHTFMLLLVHKLLHLSDLFENRFVKWQQTYGLLIKDVGRCLAAYIRSLFLWSILLGTVVWQMWLDLILFLFFFC